MGLTQSKERRASSSAKSLKSISSAKSGGTRSETSTTRWSRADSRLYSHESRGEDDSQSLSRSLSPSENGWDDSDNDATLGKPGRKVMDTVSGSETGSRSSGGKRSARRSQATTGVKEVKVIKTFGNKWDDTFNQTGESRYERQIIDQYYYTPVREKPDCLAQNEEEKRKKKEQRATRKSARDAKRPKLFRKTKGSGDEKPVQKHPVEVAIEMSKRLGIFTVAKKGLDHLPEDMLEKLPGTVTVMDLSSNKLTIIPAELCKYVLASRFSAAFNRITAVPPYFGKMTGLRKVDLSNNQVEYIPDELFRNMRELEELDLSNNQLTTLPSSLFSSPKLLHLNVSGNRLTTISNEISHMKWLMILDLSSNLITNLPESLGANLQLRKLVLDNNKISSIPSTLLLSCSELRMISIKQNPVKMINLKSTDGFDAYVDRCLTSRPKYLPRDSPDILKEYILADP